MKKKDDMGYRHILVLTLLLPAWSFGADLQPIGRLFTSPSERTALDEMRQRHLSGVKGPEAQAVQPDNSPVVVNGIVRRSSGKSTAWINQVPQDETSRRDGGSPATTVRLPSGAAIKLKPGQSFDTSTGTIRDAYQPAREPVR